MKFSFSGKMKFFLLLSVMITAKAGKQCLILFRTQQQEMKATVIHLLFQQTEKQCIR